MRFSTGEWSPYISQKLPQGGPLLNIVRDAFAAEGIHIEFEFMPWIRAMEQARLGEVTGTAAWSYNDERNKSFTYSDSIYDIEYSFFYLRKSRFDWQHLSDVQGLKVGVTRGYFYNDDFVEFSKQNKQDITTVSSEEQLFKMLLSGRVDVVLASTPVGYHIMRNRLPAGAEWKITHHRKPLAVEPIHVLFSRRIKTNFILAEKFNRGLNTLKLKRKFSEYFPPISVPMSAPQTL